MLHRPWRLFAIAALSGAWLFAVVAGVGAEEGTASQIPNAAAAQAGAAAVQSFAELLKAEAARAEAATKHDSEVIHHALTVFSWFVGVVGAVVVAGATIVGALFVKWNRETIRDIYQNEVRSQLQARFRDVDAENARTLTRVTDLTEQLSQQQAIITKLVTMTTGVFPYTYLRDIYMKKSGKEPNQDFIFRDESAFKREMGFLIDNGFIENINLDLFKGGQNILDQLTVTEAGRLLISLRESRAPY
jgi:hypothetical protein